MNSIWTWLKELDKKLDRRECASLYSRNPGLDSYYYKETFALVALFGLIIYLLTRPAFDGFFYPEDFIWPGLYLRANENFLRAIFTPFGSGNIFFRPASGAWVISTQLLLPWDPMLLHIRNFLFTLVNLFLLHRIMLRVTVSPIARVLGMAFFSLFKVHLSIIGMGSAMELIATLLHFLATLLFLLRYFQERKSVDYILAIVFFALSIFSRDHGIVLLIVVFTVFFFRAYECRKQPATWQEAVLKFSPFMAVAVVYLVVRFGLIVGLPPMGGEAAYTITVEPERILTVGATYIGDLLNLSLPESLNLYLPGSMPPFAAFAIVTGRGNLATLLTSNATIHYAYKIGFLAFGSLLIFWTMSRGIWHRKWAVFSLVWAIVIIGPTLLTRSVQTYYMYEPAAAMALLLAMTLDRNIPGRRVLLSLWVLVLLIIGLNGYAHNQNVDVLFWRNNANNLNKINEQIFMPNRNSPVRSLTIIAPTQQQADYIQQLTLGPGKTPVLRVLLTPAEIEFRIITCKDYYLDQETQSPMDLVYLFQERDFSFTRILPEQISPLTPSVTCDSFEGEVGNIETVWVTNTNTSYHLNHDSAYVSDGRQSIQVSVAAAGQADPHYGGIGIYKSDLYAPWNNAFAIDLWVDRPQNVSAIFVYVVDDTGHIIYAWVNKNPGDTLIASQKSRLQFRKGTDNIFGFQWSPQDRVGSPQALHFFVSVKEGKEVVYYLDQLCAISDEQAISPIDADGENPAASAEVENPNGIEWTEGGEQFFWMGQGDTVIRVVSNRAGVAILVGYFNPGPSLPETYVRRVLVTTDQGYEKEEVFTREGDSFIPVPVAEGTTQIVLHPLDKPTVAQLPNGDTRPLLLGVKGLRINSLVTDENPAAIAGIENPNGIEQMESGEQFFWIGLGDTAVNVISYKTGTVVPEGYFLPGPSLPEASARRLMVRTDQGYEKAETFAGEGNGVLSVPVVEGITRIMLHPLDEPTVQLPNDPRPLLLGVQGMHIGGFSESQEETAGS